MTSLIDQISQTAALLAKCKKNAERKLLQLQKATLECERWRELFHEAELLQSHYYLWHQGMSALTVEDWQEEGISRTIILTPPRPLSLEIEGRYRRSKKLRLAQKKLRSLRKSTAHEIAILMQQLRDLEAIEDEKGWQRFTEKHNPSPPRSKIKTSTSKSSKSPYHRYRTAAGWQLFAGKGAIGNDDLTFKVAESNDWWLHVDGFSGAHVVLQRPQGEKSENKEPDDESLQDALLVAMVHSKAKGEKKAAVAITQVKHVKRSGKGKANLGKVLLSQYRVMQTEFNLDRLQKLKERTREE